MAQAKRTTPEDRAAEEAAGTNVSEQHQQRPAPESDLLPGHWRQKFAGLVRQHLLRNAPSAETEVPEFDELFDIIRDRGPATALGDIARALRMGVEDVLRFDELDQIGWFHLMAEQIGKPKVDVKRLQQELEFQENTQPMQRQIQLLNDYGQPTSLTVTSMSIGTITSDYQPDPEAGKQSVTFKQINLDVNDQWRNYTVLWQGATNTHTRLPVIDPTKPVMLRIDSGCHSGMVCGDTQCDCHRQLLEAKNRIVEFEGGQGLIVHIMGQDGRGMGPHFKNKTLEIQHESGVDNVTAARLMALTNQIDRRTYDGALAVLRYLGIESHVPIVLLTNNTQGNPEFDVHSKMGIFTRNGYSVERRPIVIEGMDHIRHHLEAKDAVLGHETGHGDTIASDERESLS